MQHLLQKVLKQVQESLQGFHTRKEIYNDHSIQI